MDVIVKRFIEATESKDISVIRDGKEMMYDQIVNGVEENI